MPEQPATPPSLSRRHLLSYAAAATAAASTALALGDVPASASTPPAETPTGPSALMTALRDDPLGVSGTTPRIWWQVPVLPGALGGAQAAYEAQLTRDPRGFVSGARTETTGLVRSTASTAVAWPFSPLKPRSVGYWRVRTRNGAGTGRTTNWSHAQRVVVGPLVDSDWADAKSVWVARPNRPDFSNAVFTASLQIRQLRAGFFIRTSDDMRNGYMWQLVAGAPGLLRRHVVTDGTYTLLAEVQLGVPIPADTAVQVRFEVSGDTVRTSINGTLVDEVGSVTGSGAFGARTGGGESFWLDDVQITDANGTVLFADAFTGEGDAPTFGSLDNGRLLVGTSTTGLFGVSSSDSWALIRREFTLPRGTITGAYLHATGQSPTPARQHVYRAWCNGQHIGVGPARSADGPHYQTHDLTDLLRPGTGNALAFQCWTQSGQQFQALLDVFYSDGTVITVTSGPEWTARAGGTLLPWAGNFQTPYYVAPNEAIDARHEPVGWHSPGYTGGGFAPVAVADPIAGLIPAASAAIARVEHQPASIKKIADGQWLVDTGREMTAGLRLSLDAANLSGTKVELRFGEELNADGTVRYNLRAQTTYREIWTLRDGPQQLEHWGYRVFRWAQLITDPALDLSGAVTLLEHVVPQPDQTGSFASADPDLDKVWGLCAYTVTANRQDVHMDSATRERDAYEGDLVVHGRGEMALLRSYDIVRQTNRYLLRRPTWPTEYKFMTITTAWEEYLETGDADALAADYDLHVAEQGERWLDADGLVRKTPGSLSSPNADIVDWPQSQRDGYVMADVNTVVNSWQYQAFVILEKVATVLGRTSDAARYQALSDRMRTAVNDKFYDPATGAYYDGEGTTHTAQHASLYAASLGVAKEADLPKIAGWLASDTANPVRVSANCVQWLLEALFLGGQGQSAIDIMTSRRDASWLSMMETWGATQTMEAWSPTVKSNTTFSHPWASAPLNIIARHLLGVRVSEAGASQISVNPQPGNLAWVRGSVPTVRGLVHVDIEQSPGYRIALTIPGNTTGTLRWPLAGHRLGDFALTSPPGSHTRAKTDGDHLVVPLLPGSTAVALKS